MHGFCPLASGSSGNCLYLGTDHTRLLIDFGISCRSVQHRLHRLGIDLSTIDAVLISHEHADHISGLETFSAKLQTPILANQCTAEMLDRGLSLHSPFLIFTTDEVFSFRDLTITPFSVSHDTPDPVMFRIEVNGLSIGICTDLGFATPQVKHHLKGCHVLYLEANHEPSMVHASSRPDSYKQRVLGKQGHLSNDACMALLQELLHPCLSHVYLAHLSEECNAPALVLKKAREILKNHDASLSLALHKKMGFFYLI